MINPYDLGNFQLTENAQRINIDKLVSRINKELKLRLLQAQIEALGISVKLTVSKTRFNGERFWFICPQCSKRSGILYKHPLRAILGCRVCLELKYQKQRFKGMVECI